jgi:hypothetical protein
MRIVPVNFNKRLDDRGRIAINPDKSDKLITALRTVGKLLLITSSR